MRLANFDRRQRLIVAAALRVAAVTDDIDTALLFADMGIVQPGPLEFAELANLYEAAEDVRLALP